jgi:hypothetical protein
VTESPRDQAAWGWQLCTWLTEGAHCQAARVWWGVAIEADALDEFLTLAFMLSIKAKTAHRFDWRATAKRMFSETLASHGSLHAESFNLMKRAALDALSVGETRQQAAVAAATVAKTRECPPPPYLVADAADFAEKDIFFANLRAGTPGTKRKTKIRARR